MGDVGAVATVVNTLASWFMSEDGYAEWSKRRQLAALRKKADAALASGDLVAYRLARAELERLSDAA